MEKLKVIKFINACLFFAALVQASTGVFLFFVGQGSWVERVGEIHRYTGLLLLALIVAHIFLFWPVIKHHYFKKAVPKTV